jgi:hypothetical protein
MADESVPQNPQDPAEERFARLEEKFIDISRSISLLMEALVSNIELFWEVRGSNSKIKSKGKLGDHEDP